MADDPKNDVKDDAVVVETPPRRRRVPPPGPVREPLLARMIVILPWGLSVLMIACEFFITVDWAKVRRDLAAEHAATRAAKDAQEARDRICLEQASRNARAWATFMHLKDPAVICNEWEAAGWEATGGNTPLCERVRICAVGSEGNIYGIRCLVGAVEEEGQADRCRLVSGGGRR